MIQLLSNTNDGSYQWVEGTYTVSDIDAANSAARASAVAFTAWLAAHAQIRPTPGP